MTFSALKVSLVALALVSAVGVADAKKKQANDTLPMAEQNAATQLTEIQQFLAGGKDLTRMKLPRLQQRLHRAETLRATPNLPPDMEQALEQEIARVAKEIGSREQGAAGQPQPEPQADAQQQPEPGIEEPPLPPYDPRNAPEQAQPAAQPGAPAAQPPVAETPTTPPPVSQPAPVAPRDKQLANPKVNPELEKRAQAYLDDTTDVRAMKRKQLRKRLSAIRDVLATNQLSPQTREAVRLKLARERAVLRNDVAVDEGLPPASQAPVPPKPAQQQGSQQPAPPPPQQGSTTNNSRVTYNTINTDVQLVLQDRRPPRDLDDRELVRRIDVYRDVVADDRYDAAQRMMWRQQMEEDRRYLRRQMMAERQRREARLRQGEYQFDHQVQDRYEPGYDVPDDVFAAEVEDDELADVLVAPPRRQIQRRYTVDDIERSPQVREAMARIEIDTVHFGFGEGYLREEEIDKLDRIASVLEKILARHPDEVFLIEGHTDAVGSDASNLVLSRQRAAAVKEALATYYVIPPENLKTVGLGERYLKIPTLQPEAENRRVSLARITPLVGQAAD